MKICRPRPQLVFTFDNRFSSTGCAAQQSVPYIIFRLQASYLSATSHTGRESCRVKSLYMKRFWEWCTFCMYHKIKMCGRVTVHKWLLVGAYENLLILEFVSIHSQHFSLPKSLHANIFIVNTKPFIWSTHWKHQRFLLFTYFMDFWRGRGHSHLQGGGTPWKLHFVMSLIFTSCCLHYIRK
jgi:hypothetical protein